MTALWYPDATHVLQPDNGAFTGGPPKGLLHSTESVFGHGWASFKPGTLPHFEVTALPATRDVAVRQYYPLNQPSRSLADGPLAVRTNRDGVIQVELGFQAAKVAEVPDWFWARTVPLLRWIEDNANVDPWTWAEFKAYPASYGKNNGVRFTTAKWDSYGGWCGHQHCPDGNAHGDPGLIPVDKLRRVKVTPPAFEAKGEPPVLRPGDTTHHGWVRVLKAELNKLGATLPVTGVYDPRTAARVRRYKLRHGILPPSAKVDLRVWRSLGVKV